MIFKVLAARQSRPNPNIDQTLLIAPDAVGNWNMLIGCILGAAAIAVRYPDLWQTQNIAEAEIWQGFCKIWQDMRRALRAASERVGDRINLRVIWGKPRGLKRATVGRNDLDCGKSLAIQMPAQCGQDAVRVGSHYKPQLTGRARAA